MATGTTGWMKRCWLVASLLLPPSLFAQPVPEYELKTAFVYNFVLFTEWPAETVFEGGTLNICVNPNSPMRASLASLRGRPAKGRKIAIRSLALADDVRQCHVLFVDSHDGERWLQIDRKLANAGILTISDEDASPDGSIIELDSSDNRVVFDVDTTRARRAGLVLSSKLLRLARTVK